jgi:hypothetical protein
MRGVEPTHALKKNFLDMNFPSLPYSFGRRRPRRRHQFPTEKKVEFRSAPQQPGSHQKKKEKRKAFGTSSTTLNPSGVQSVPSKNLSLSVQRHRLLDLGTRQKGANGTSRTREKKKHGYHTWAESLSTPNL